MKEKEQEVRWLPSGRYGSGGLIVHTYHGDLTCEGIVSETARFSLLLSNCFLKISFFSTRFSGIRPGDAADGGRGIDWREALARSLAHRRTEVPIEEVLVRVGWL